MRQAATSILFTFFFALAALPAAAQEKSQTPANCPPLTMVNTIQMVRNLNGQEDLVPITFEAGQRFFLFDTGGARTQIGLYAAKELNLHTFSGNIVLSDLAGRSSSKMAQIDVFALGHMKVESMNLPVSPTAMDGILALDYQLAYDMDVDFGTDKLNIFSPVHCPGNVLYWTAPAVAVLPATVDNNFHLTVPVKLDGHEYKAVIDSGTARTSFRMDLAKRDFDLTMGSPDTPPAGRLNGNPLMRTYLHSFKNMTFGDIAVNNPRIDIYPNDDLNRMRAHAEPELIIGMDVLRKLHLYVAFKEGKMYVTEASKPVAGTDETPLPAAYFANQIGAINGIFAEVTAHTLSAPRINEAGLLSQRCFWRAAAKTDLEAGLSDCQQSLAAKPDSATTLGNQGLTYFQQGKFQEAVQSYDAGLKLDAKMASLLYMRGIANAKLGDSAGRDADITAAKALEPDIAGYFHRLGISD